MKLCRIGELGKEKPAIIDKDGSYKDLSSAVSDFNPENFKRPIKISHDLVDAKNKKVVYERGYKSLYQKNVLPATLGCDFNFLQNKKIK